jgi:predicted dehydrogenase
MRVGKTPVGTLEKLANPHSRSFRSLIKATFEDTLQLRMLLYEFANSIQEKQPFKCSGEMGLRDIRIAEAIYRSAKQGGTRVEIKV